MENRQTIVACLALLASVSLIFAQATLDPRARASEDGRPAPAAERIEPNLDAWWQSAVFYEVFVRSFADSTEGPLAGDGVGDLRGLIERLDYLNDGDPTTDTDLGVTALWLMPIWQSPSYHGYDTTDYYAVDDEYGTNDDFRDLIAACHERGIRVIIDLVLNHSSGEHPWFTASTDPGSDKRDWYLWRDQRPEWKGPWGQQVWHESPANDGSYFYGLFWHGMPDLNYASEAVTQEMFELVRFWLEDMGADGFRLDAIRHLIEDGKIQENTPATHAWLRRYFEHVKSINPDAVSIGEVWADSDAVSRYVGDQVDLGFEFETAYKLVESVRDQNPAAFITQMRIVQEKYPLGMYATFLRNHDQPRVLHELGGDRAAAGLAATIQFCLPGVPFVYYGEEIGMSADKPDPELRTPMQWSAEPNAGFSTTGAWKDPKSDYQDINVAAQTDDADSMLSHYRRLIALRRSTPALRIGTYTEVESSNPGVLAFERELDGERLLCVFNLTDAPIADYRLDVDSEFAPIEDLLGGAVTPNANHPVAELAPRSAAIVRLGE